MHRTAGLLVPPLPEPRQLLLSQLLVGGRIPGQTQPLKKRPVKIRRQLVNYQTPQELRHIHGPGVIEQVRPVHV